MRLRHSMGFLVLAFGLLGGAGPAAAQTLNIDFGSVRTVPSDSLGAAAGQAGQWNKITTLGLTSALKNLAGETTGVALVVDALAINGSSGAVVGDISRLRSDNFYSDGGRHWSVTLTGLQAGEYDAYFYSPYHAAVPTRDFTANGVAVANLDGNAAETLVEGQDWVRVRVSVTGGVLAMTSAHTEGNGGLAGMQLVRLSEDTPAVPEPSAALLFLPALGVMAFLKRRRSA